jgi:anti-anti-sigma factor
MNVARPTPFNIERSPISDGVCRLSIIGELDIATTPQLQDAVNEARAGGAYTVDIDLADLSFIDSTGLRMFLALNQQAASEGWSLVLARPSESLKTILQVTGVEDELPIAHERSTP